MPRGTNSNLNELLSKDKDLLRSLVREAVQQVLEAEMTEVVGADRSERTSERKGYRSGYYERGLVTRVGLLELRVPRDRAGQFRTEVFERYQRSEKALVTALMEMYVQGVSTRKVKAITEELCGHEFSASTISRLNKGLDETLDRFARRPLEEARRRSSCSPAAPKCLRKRARRLCGTTRSSTRSSTSPARPMPSRSTT